MCLVNCQKIQLPHQLTQFLVRWKRWSQTSPMELTSFLGVYLFQKKMPYVLEVVSPLVAPKPFVVSLLDGLLLMFAFQDKLKGNLIIGWGIYNFQIGVVYIIGLNSTHFSHSLFHFQKFLFPLLIFYSPTISQETKPWVSMLLVPLPPKQFARFKIASSSLSLCVFGLTSCCPTKVSCYICFPTLTAYVYSQIFNGTKGFFLVFPYRFLTWIEFHSLKVIITSLPSFNYLQWY